MFRFRQFTVHHGQSSMKVGTDAVLLGAWADLAGAADILDIGTGCGVIALMAAQRAPGARVTGIDIHRESAEEAAANFGASPFADRLTAVHADLTPFAAVAGSGRGYDCVVSNPPFFSETLTSPDGIRAGARSMAAGLTFDALIAGAVACMPQGGSLQVIVPYREATHILGEATFAGLHLLRRTDVLTKSAAPPRRVLLHWTTHPVTSPILHDRICLTDIHGGRSAEYQSLTADFYL